jgi:hypothetical protein
MGIRVFGLAAMALVMSCVSAAAQPQWSLTREGDQLFLQIPADAPMPAVDDLLPRLREELQWPAAAPVPVRVGDRVAWGVSEMPEIGRLRNDIFRPGQMGQQPTLLLPRGTPVYMTRYNYTVEAATGPRAVHDLTWRVWCGAVRAPAAGAPRGYCIRSTQSGTQAAAVGEGVSPYLPSSLGAFAPSTVPDIDQTDGSARAEVPPIEFTYVLDRVRDNRFELTSILKAGGDEVRVAVNAPRGRDGVGALDDGGVIARIRPGADASSFTVELLEPNDAPLREIASAMLSDARGTRGN